MEWPSADDRLLSSDFLMRPDQLGHDRLLHRRGCACRHVRLLLRYRNDQPVFEIAMLAGENIEETAHTLAHACFRHTGNDTEIETDSRDILKVLDAAHRHSRKAGDQRMPVKTKPATFGHRLERMIRRPKGGHQLRRQLDRIDVGYARLELADNRDLALHVPSGR